MEPNQIRITVVVDNHAGQGLEAEHGLALWIETPEGRILFDTGAGRALGANAKALGVDLRATDTLVLSHGHYDHTGAIPRVLEAAQRCEVYCHPGAMQPRFSIRDGAAKPIGMQRESILALERLPPQRIHWVSQPTQLSEAIGITGPIPRETAYEGTGGPFFLDSGGKHPDLIDDDLALWLRTAAGLVVCVGCCHAGLANTLAHIRRLTDDAKIRAVIGGFHLIDASEERLERTVSVVEGLAPEAVIPCHCTGERAAAAFRERLGRRIVPGAAGEVYQF